MLSCQLLFKISVGWHVGSSQEIPSEGPAKVRITRGWAKLTQECQKSKECRHSSFFSRGLLEGRVAFPEVFQENIFLHRFPAQHGVLLLKLAEFNTSMVKKCEHGI